MKKHVKVAVSGSAGQIGYALLPRLASGQAFGPDVTVDFTSILLSPPRILRDFLLSSCNLRLADHPNHKVTILLLSAGPTIYAFPPAFSIASATDWGLSGA